MSDDICDSFRSERHFSDLGFSQSVCPCSISNIQATLLEIIKGLYLLGPSCPAI